MRTSLAALVVIAAPVLAYKDTSPLLIWSAAPNEAIADAAEVITSGVIGAQDVYGSMASLGCDWEKMVVLRVDELHNSHIPSMSIASSSKPDLHIPYLVKPTREAFDTAIHEWALICGATVADDVRAQPSGKSILMLDAQRGDSILTGLNTLPPYDVLILHGSRAASASSRPLSFDKRQTAPDDDDERPFPSRPSPHEPGAGSGRNRTNGTVPTDAPLLDRVQILTTPVITALLISFGIFVPLIMFGVNALAGIQVPPRMLEIGKTIAVSRDKKEQ